MDASARRLNRLQRRQRGKQLRSRKEVDRLKRRIIKMEVEITKNTSKIETVRSNLRARIDALTERVVALEPEE